MSLLDVRSPWVVLCKLYTRSLNRLSLPNKCLHRYILENISSDTPGYSIEENRTSLSLSMLKFEKKTSVKIEFKIFYTVERIEI